MTSNRALSEGEARGERIIANCKIIWGDCDYDLGLETDDYDYYLAFVRKDYGFKFGDILCMVAATGGPDNVCAQLDQKLSEVARRVLESRRRVGMNSFKCN